MVESFIQRKKRRAAKIFFYAATSGVSAALLALGGVVLTLKRLGHAVPWYAYLACVLVGAVVAGLILLLGYPGVKRFAKHLDNEYALGEKVQTMIEYADEQNAMLQIQREDAEATVAALPKPKKGFPFWAQAVVLPILAISLFTVSLAVPGNAAPNKEGSSLGLIGGEAEEMFDCESAIPRMELVIENVERSKLDEGLKTEYLAALRALLGTLQEGDLTVASMQVLVRETMNVIFKATTTANTFNAFVTAAKENTELSDFRESLRSSRNAYETAQIADRFEMDYTDMQTGVETALERYVTSLQTKMNAAVSTQQAFLECISLHRQSIDIVLVDEGVQALSDEDGIKSAVTALRAVIFAQEEGLKDATSGISVSGAISNINDGLDVFTSMNGSVEALCHQAHSFMIKEYVMEQLEDIFNVRAPQEEEGTETEINTGTGGGGGGGSGTLNFPGNGVVLDIDDIAYVKYYLLLGEYRGKYDEWITDKNNPQLSDELKKYIEAYFQGLTSKGSED